MFRILKIDGTELGYADNVRYIKVGVNGSFVQTCAEDATGIAFNGEPYKLEDILISELDGGKLVAELNEELQNQIEMQTMTELAVTEIAEIQITDQTANELALAELAGMIGG